MFAVDDLASGKSAGRPVALLRMGRAMIDLYCKLFTQVPKRITLDIDRTCSTPSRRPVIAVVQCAL